MDSDNVLYCRLFKKNISVGLCADISAVSSCLLKQDAVPEIAEFTREAVRYACDHCQHVE